MMSLLRLEGYKIRYSRGLWIVIAIVIILNVMMGSVPFKTAAQFRGMHFSTMKIAHSIDIDSIDEFDKWHRTEYPKYVVPKAFSDSSSITWISLIFAAYFFGIDFTNRTFTGAGYAGKSRSRILLSKVAWFYVLLLLITFVSYLILFQIYAPGWTNAMPADYLWRSFGMVALLNCGVMSVPLLIAFMCRGIFKSTVFTTLYTFGLFFLQTGLRGTGLNSVISLYPPILQTKTELWEVTASSSVFYEAAIPSLCIIFICVATSLLIFRKAELR